MKKIFLLLASASLLAIAGCGNGKKDDAANIDVPKGMVAADISSQGLPIQIIVPDSTVGPLEIIANPQGGADVKVGKNFQVTIIEEPGNMTMKKNDIEHDDVKKLIKYLVNDSIAIAWECQVPTQEPEFHFYAIVKSEGKTFEVHDVDGEIFSEKAATQMLDAAKTIRLKAQVKAAS